MHKPDKRGQWSSKLGFIFAAAGSAVGLGNIWRFPYMTGENGGAAFVIVYLACVFFIGLPLLYNELALGRYSGANPIGAFKRTKPRTVFVLTGVLCLLLCFVVLSYYGVIAGWALGYAMNTLLGKKVVFEEFAKDPGYVIPLFGLFILLTVVIVQAGIESGIEKWSKVLMPILFVLMVVIIVRSITFEGASKGLEYYLKPDFSKINGEVVLKAMGQAFFSLSVGWGLMITYGSYMPRTQSILNCGFWVVVADTAVALLGGFMVFPAVFAFGMDPAEGPALTFVTLPAVFEKMPAGALVGALFFILLTIAALTSSISMLEVPVSYFVDEKKAKRKTACWLVGILAFVAGIPSALSTGGVKWLTEIPVGGTAEVRITDRHTGPINESDVDRAAAMHEMVVAFDTSLEEGVAALAREEGVEILEFTSLSDMTNSIQTILDGRVRKDVMEAKLLVKVGRPDLRASVLEALQQIKSRKVMSFMDLMDYVFGTILVVFIAFLCSVYVGWVWNLKHAIEEIQKCSPYFTKPLHSGVPLSMIWGFFIQYVCPLVILIVLLSKLGVF